MTANSGDALWITEDRNRLTSLMDKLAAVQMDLKPLCNRETSPGQATTSPETTIAEVCEILQTAIVDLREVIRRLDGMSEPGGSGSHATGSA